MSQNLTFEQHKKKCEQIMRSYFHDGKWPTAHFNGEAFTKSQYGDACKRVYNYGIKNGGKEPDKVWWYNSTTTTSKGPIQTACEKLLGSFTTFTQFYNKCKGRGYSYYYNDIKTLSQESSTIANLNCVDSTQLAYHLAKEMGYEFHIYRVKCTVSKSGHVYGGIKGKEFTKLTKVDMAACMSKSSQYIIGNVWCSDAKILAIDEETWLKDDGVT